MHCALERDRERESRAAEAGAAAPPRSSVRAEPSSRYQQSAPTSFFSPQSPTAASFFSSGFCCRILGSIRQRPAVPYKSYPFWISDYNCSSRSASCLPPCDLVARKVRRWRSEGSCRTTSSPTSCAACRRAAWLFPVASARPGVTSSMPGGCCVRTCSRALSAVVSSTTARSIHRSSWPAPRRGPLSPATSSSSLGSLMSWTTATAWCFAQRPHAIVIMSLTPRHGSGHSWHCPRNWTSR